MVYAPGEKGQDLTALKSELEAMRVTARRKRAIAAGVSENALDDAEESEDPRAALIELILKHEMPPPAIKPDRVDTKAMTGLRGLAALHVGVGHIIKHHYPTIDILGSAAMTFFFLLSGFVMTLGYGQLKKGSAFPTRKFLQNRFARLAPVYYLTNLIMVWVYPFTDDEWRTVDGVDLAPVSSILSVFGLNSWALMLELSPPNAVCWTMSTMMFFYLCYPHILPRIHRMTEHSISQWMGALYWISCVRTRVKYAFLVLSYCLTSAALAARRIASWTVVSMATSLILMWTGLMTVDARAMYWAGRVFPPARLPLFIMGALAALHRMADMQHSHILQADVQPEAVGTDAEAPLSQLVWKVHTKQQARGSWFCCCFARAKCNANGVVSCDTADDDDGRAGCCRGDDCKDEPEVWGQYADFYFCLYWFGLAALVLGVQCTGIYVSKDWATMLSSVLRVSIELFNAPLCLAMILSMTRDEGHSYTANLMRSAPLQQLGEVSMSFYLVRLARCCNLIGTRLLSILFNVHWLIIMPMARSYMSL